MPTQTQPPPAAPPQPPAAAPPAIDLQALAEKVYALLKAELRLERERRP